MFLEMHDWGVGNVDYHVWFKVRGYGQVVVEDLVVHLQNDVGGVQDREVVVVRDFVLPLRDDLGEVQAMDVAV